MNEKIDKINKILESGNLPIALRKELEKRKQILLNDKEVKK